MSGPVPKHGAYGVVRTGGIVGVLIRLATRSQVNHAFVVVSRTEIVESRWRGARVSPLSSYDGHLIVYNDLEPLNDAERLAIVAAAERLVGTPYNFLDILTLGLASLGLRWRWLVIGAERAQALICSQLVDRAYLDAAVHLYDDGRLTGQVTPGDLLLRVAQHPWTVT